MKNRAPAPFRYLALLHSGSFEPFSLLGRRCRIKKSTFGAVSHLRACWHKVTRRSSIRCHGLGRFSGEPSGNRVSYMPVFGNGLNASSKFPRYPLEVSYLLAGLLPVRNFMFSRQLP